MGAVRIEDRHYSYEEYIDLLNSSKFKIEYLDGQLRMMSGGSQAHASINDTLQGELYLRRGDCKVRGSNVAVYVESSNRYYYPDLTVVCADEQQYTNASIAQLVNPTMIVEVLSKGTEHIDRGEKFHAYFSIPSFMEYILVDSRSVRVDAFYREAPDSWSMRSYYRMDDEVEFRSMGVRLPIHMIYAEVTL